VSNLELFIKVVIALIIIIVMAQLLGRTIRLMGQPAVVGEMISGVLLGPTLFGNLFPEAAGEVFPKDIMPALFIISNLGLSVYMFLVGAELDLKLFNRQALRDATALSTAAVLVPFLLGAMAACLFNDSINAKHIDSFSMIIFLGTALAITAFPMLARILQEKNMVNSHIGALSLLSASIQDVISWILLGLVTVMCTTQQYSGIAIMVAGAAALVIVLFYVVRPLLAKSAGRILQFGDLTSGDFGIVFVLLLASALITDWLGLYSVFGGFIFGLSLPRNGFYIQAITMRLKDVTVMALLPVFFAFSGLNTNILNLGELNLLLPTLVILLFAFASKYFSVMFTMRWVSRFSWREASAIGGLINARGLMELIIANIGLFYGLIDTNLYSILVLVAITSTLAAMPIYNWSMGRNARV
jgi:Kef-type K+ transport system membrane component KefB